MCLIQTQDPGAMPVEDDSIPSATALELGGVGRGAAGLGRLKLRTGQEPVAAPTQDPNAPVAVVDAQPAAPVGLSSLALPSGSDNGVRSDRQGGPSPWKRSPNSDLRLPVDD